MLWSAIILLTTTMSMILVYLALVSQNNNYVILVTDSINVPIWFYQFPAITLCHLNQISKKSLSTIIQNFKTKENMSEEVLTQLFKSIINIHPFYNGKYSIDDLNLLQEILEYNNETVENVIEKIGPTCNEELHYCYWKDEQKACNVLFKPIKTSFGICCTFNMIAYKHQKNNTYDKNLKPKRVSSCGILSGLRVARKIEVNDSFAPIIPSYGVLILIHNSYEMPSKSDLMLLQFSQTVRQISVTPSFTTMNKEVRNALKDNKKCLFKDEQKMKIFKQYTFRNCIYECEIQKIIDICLCIPFHVKHINDKFTSERTCNLRDVPCMKRSAYANCTCQGNCEYYKYTLSYSTGSFSGKHYHYNVSNSDVTLLEVSFTDLSSLRNTYVFSSTWSSAFSSSGGILSLFTGFSFKAVLEIIYLVIIHLGKEIILQQHNPIDYRN